jgi:hypothetical protein
MPNIVSRSAIIDEGAAVSDYDRYLDAVSIKTVTETLKSMEVTARHSDLTEGGGHFAANLAINALENGLPFSLVRIGDGEGNILGSLDATHMMARQYSTQKILEMMFGKCDFPENQIFNMRKDMVSSVLSADVLGVSDYVRIERLKSLRESYQIHEDIRGHMGSYESIMQVSSIIGQFDHRPSCLVSNYAHKQMIGLLGDIIRYANKVTVIGPYDLRQDIISAFVVKNVDCIIIPNQHSSNPSSGCNWFSHYSKILEDIVAEQKHLFLVAAGILGKGLCHEIKMKNGVAIDFGSVIDVWMGKPVRNYHSPEFVERHRLSASMRR